MVLVNACSVYSELLMKSPVPSITFLQRTGSKSDLDARLRHSVFPDTPAWHITCFQNIPKKPGTYSHRTAYYGFIWL